MKTEIVYRTKPSRRDLQELAELMPLLDITLTKLERNNLVVTHDTFYNVYRLDWEWHNTLFNQSMDVRCLCLDQDELDNIGVKQHWGFYSLDFDTKHQFYMTNLDTLDPRAKQNGFNTSFAWMFVHEYLHGAVWEETRDLQKAAELVHVWEAAGVLKQKLTEHLARYDRLKEQVTLLERIIRLIKRLV